MGRGNRDRPDRRQILCAGAAVASGLVAAGLARAQESKAAQRTPADKGKPTRFQIACMTLVYSQFPMERALSGIKSAGYSYVAWGTSHAEAGGKRQPIMPEDAPPEKAKELGKRCRDLGL